MRFSGPAAFKAGIFFATAAEVNAFWRMPCHGRTGLALIDPLVDPGVPSEHQHAIHGGSAFSTTSTTDDLLKSDCTSCAVSQDNSAYWTPSLYFKDAATGEYKLVEQVGGMLAYYLLNPIGVEEKIHGFPKGFEMIAGDTRQRNFTWPIPDKPTSAWTGDLQSQAFLKQYSIGFNCLDYTGAAEGSLDRHFMPEKDFLDEKCKNGIRMELFFPSCWDGKNLDGVNHDKISHMAYPSLGQTGTCPEGYPARTVRLFYETIWNTYAFKGQAGQFVFANGDPTGFGYHGDFIMGWDEEFLQQAVDQCTDSSGEIENCPLFDIKPHPEYDSPTCQLENNGGLTSASSIFKEVDGDVSGLKQLPGNVQIVDGPGYASGGHKAPEVASPPAVPSPSEPEVDNVAAAEPASPSAPDVAGAAFAATSESIAPPTPESSSAAAFTPEASPPTTTAAPSPEAPVQAESYFSTQTITKGREVMEILWAEETVTVTASSTPSPAANYARAKRHLHKHRREQN